MNNNPRILVVDDDANLRKTLADILRVKGYEVVVAANGTEGVTEAKRAFVSVALIDLKLPDMSGIEVMEQIKMFSPLSEAIILTGHAALESAIEAINRGAFSYLLKPYDIERLLRHVHRAWDRQQTQREILRLASFPKMNPNPVLEVNSKGEITYLNPASERIFPGLQVAQLVPEVLGDMAAMANGEPHAVAREITVGDSTFDQFLYPVPDSDLIRIYMLDVSKRKEHEEKVKRLNFLLLILRDINEKLLTVDNEQQLFQFVCDSLSKLEDIVIAWIVLKELDPKIMPVAWTGVDEATLSALQVRWDDAEQGIGFIGEAIRQLKTVVVHDAETDAQLAAWQEMIKQWQIKSAIAIPVHEGGEPIATISMFSRKPAAFDEEFVNFLHEVAGNVAIGIHTLRLDRNLHATLDHLRISMNSTVETIASMVELRDPYTAGHERRVAQLASAIGKEMGLPERQVEGLRVIGYVHDIGKLGVPAEILSKPGALTDIERMLLQAHPRTGYDILAKLDFPWPVAQAVLQHHERLDGSGYPQGLKAQDIILEARILMVADVVEAMSSHRPYRASLGMDSAIAEITDNKGKFYDPDVVDACVRLFTEQEFSLGSSY